MQLSYPQNVPVENIQQVPVVISHSRRRRLKSRPMDLRQASAERGHKHMKYILVQGIQKKEDRNEFLILTKPSSLVQCDQSEEATGVFYATPTPKNKRSTDNIRGQDRRCERSIFPQVCVAQLGLSHTTIPDLNVLIIFTTLLRIQRRAIVQSDGALGS